MRVARGARIHIPGPVVKLPDRFFSDDVELLRARWSSQEAQSFLGWILHEFQARVPVPIPWPYPENFPLLEDRETARDLRGAEILRADLSHALIDDVDLSFSFFLGGTLHGAEFEECRLDGTIFEGLDMFSCTFRDCRAEHILFQELTATKVRFVGENALIKSGTFVEVNADGIYWGSGTVQGSVFFACDLSGSRMSRSCFDDNLLLSCDLQRLELTGARFASQAFYNCDTRNLVLDQTSTFDIVRDKGLSTTLAQFRCTHDEYLTEQMRSAAPSGQELSEARRLALLSVKMALKNVGRYAESDKFYVAERRVARKGRTIWWQCLDLFQDALWNYGTNPWLAAMWMLIDLIVFAALYWILGKQLLYDYPQGSMTLFDCGPQCAAHLSMDAFLTLGFGNWMLDPASIISTLPLLQGLTGLFLFSIFVASLARRATRD